MCSFPKSFQEAPVEQTRSVATPCHELPPSIIMLAHLKAKQREHIMSSDESADAPDRPACESALSLPTQASSAADHCPTTKMTCDALCSLGYSPPPPMHSSMLDFDMSDEKSCSKKGGMGCPKQHQLPMFLSSKFESYMLS